MEESNIRTEEEKSETPVYSQMSMEYVSTQVKKAGKKGFVRGILLSMGIFLIAGAIYGAISVVMMIVNGSFYAKVLGSTSSSILDREAINKIDTLYGLINNTYLEDIDREKLQEARAQRATLQ